MIKMRGNLVFTNDVSDYHLCEPFVDRVVTALDSFLTKFFVNSAYRDPDEDRRKGRSGTSYHCKGRALDLSTRGLDGILLRAVVLRLMNSGLTVGLYKTFIHVDDRDEPILFYGE